MKERKEIEAFSEKEKESSFIATAKDMPPIQPQPDQFEDIYNKYTDRKKIVLQPDFQRDFIWSIKKQKELIKSVWQGIPIPMFYFSRTKDDKLEVIDGQQRLTTLFGFYDNSSLPSRIRSKICKNLNLKNEEGKRISDYEIRRKMERELSLHCVVFDEEKFSSSQKYEIFRRLNQGSMILKPQEIRNCILQSAMPFFNAKIKVLAKFFENKFGREFKFTRMFGEEMVLRYFIIRKYGYEKTVSEYINFSIDRRLDNIKADFSNSDEVDNYAREFKKFIERMHSIFSENCFQMLQRGEEQPRRNTRWKAHTFSGVFNQGMFHLFSFYLPRYDDNQFNRADPARIRYFFLGLLKNKKFVNLLTGSATDQTRKIKASKELFECEFLKKCLGIWTEKDDRNISRQAKKTIFRNVPYCYLCYGKLRKIEDADHIDPFSGGYKSRFSNILLTHSRCNKEKSDKTLAEYRDSNTKLKKRIDRNRDCINEYIKCLKEWNTDHFLKDYRQLLRYAKIDRQCDKR